jgi:hypothetical protein
MTVENSKLNLSEPEFQLKFDLLSSGKIGGLLKLLEPALNTAVSPHALNLITVAFIAETHRVETVRERSRTFSGP